MATKKFPSEMSSRGTVLGTDKILIYNATTGASDEVCTVAELFAYVYSAVTTGKVPYKSATILANSPIYTDGTNVSVGGTSPSGKLHVVGAIQVGATESDAGNVASWTSVNETYGLAGASGYWGLRTGTDHGINIDVYNNNSQLTALTILNDGKVGINKTNPNYLIEVGSDSAGKPGAGGLWTVVSDERIKKDIEFADLDICYDTIKNIPLKRYAWADGVYSEEQVSDRHNLGWIAQDVQKYFSKAVSVKPFTKADGEVIEDCLDLNSGQLNAALYGAVQACMLKIESLEQEIALLKQ